MWVKLRKRYSGTVNQLNLVYFDKSQNIDCCLKIYVPLCIPRCWHCSCVSSVSESMVVGCSAKQSLLSR